MIFLFFGDYKASLIVGSSIPTSILMSLIAITMAGFSLNVITMSALVLGVGMMVDNSIVVLESCFRATAEQEDKGRWAIFQQRFTEPALSSTRSSVRRSRPVSYSCRWHS
ncbi:MAG: efflux RND transporter permease subunit [Clostridium fessum]